MHLYNFIRCWYTILYIIGTQFYILLEDFYVVFTWTVMGSRQVRSSQAPPDLATGSGGAPAPLSTRRAARPLGPEAAMGSRFGQDSCPWLATCSDDGRQCRGGHGDCYCVAVAAPTATALRRLATWWPGQLRDKAWRPGHH
jgi:hypothetical protein